MLTNLLNSDSVRCCVQWGAGLTTLLTNNKSNLTAAFKTVSSIFYFAPNIHLIVFTLTPYNSIQIFNDILSTRGNTFKKSICEGLERVQPLKTFSASLVNRCVFKCINLSSMIHRVSPS